MLHFLSECETLNMCFLFMFESFCDNDIGVDCWYISYTKVNQYILHNQYGILNGCDLFPFNYTIQIENEAELRAAIESYQDNPVGVSL